ncbi:aminotransferase class V-fold PLP-dependent enzyme [Sinimarinibacterium sp. CAU 1509]|uniref:aminotransferase class V-fold PLP-dependent enzyme n=1 Tax=Sinimarinibacterium sp. CAU 1509 TaxID=2562283 RepID=UPI0010AC6B24|nr:aminotransferase class V-fold PLP-dependent enzyme [Sinimarinibacterium sp. CAU 1509]TJY59340.1 aminotransferase class V-fold PLP-dependent enzyme [Sinimarinibacterium sp. CAU 1509]
MSIKAHFSRFLDAQPQRLHLAAHSHHPWPDVSYSAQQQAWLDAASEMDHKWEHVFGEHIPSAQQHLARLLNLPDPRSLAFGTNTHELLMRLISTIEARPFRVLTTDSEFLSFSRQIERLEQAGHCEVERVAVEPFHSFTQRFAERIRVGGHHLIFFSQVFYNSGYWIEQPERLVEMVPSRRSLVVIDGYHAFMALPVDLGRIAGRAFYLGGGYKYAMSGEGIAFMHCPPGYAECPVDTGWLASFGALASSNSSAIQYAPEGGRFWGATFDPTGLYRFNAVMDWARREQITPTAIRAHVLDLQRELIAGLDTLAHPVLNRTTLQPPLSLPRGNFLSFRHPDAAAFCAQLEAANVICDVRDQCLRIGLGIYHDYRDLRELMRRLEAL